MSPEARLLNEYQKGWTSGILDGEGSISVVWHKRNKGRLRKNGTRGPKVPYKIPRPSVRITVTNTNRPLLEAFLSIVGTGTIHEKKSKRRSNSTRQRGWTYQNSSHKHIEDFLSQVNLIAKEELRQLALELIKTKKLYKKNGQGTDPEVITKAVSLANQMCILNPRGLKIRKEV